MSKKSMYVVNITEDNIDILCVIKKKICRRNISLLNYTRRFEISSLIFVVVGFLFCILGFSIKPHAYNSS